MSEQDEAVATGLRAENPPTPRTVECPSEFTRGWRPVIEHGVMGYRDADGVVWVTARADEPHELLVVFTKISGLPPARYVRSTESWTVKGAATRERREQRELTKRGLA